MAGLLALGAAACGDDVEIVQPTPEPPPPPPPVEATMAPASASVAVGNSVVFAVNASGGVAGDAASWTCASSNTGIATVTSTSAGCSATGVAAGDVTITASVTKSGETVNVGAQLTVTAEEVVAPPEPGNPAFLVVASIEGEGDTDSSGLKGRVSVTVNVERGDQDLEGLALLVDGEVVASQSFGTGMDMGMGMTPPEDGAAEQAVHPFTMAFDSDGYDDHGHADYTNGDHTISAELEIGVTMADGMHGHETVSSNVVAVEFDNDDGYVVDAELGHNSALDDGGNLWYGGPDNEHIVIDVLPVSYSGAEAGAVVVRLTGCDAEDGDDPLSVEFDCDGQQADRTIEVFAGGNKGKILNEDDLPTVNIDMEGPDAPNFHVNPNKREDGWVNASVNFTGENGSGSKADGWLDYNDDNADEGVGGYSPRIRFAEADSDEEVGVALAAPALSALVLPASLAGKSSKADAFCVVASAVDMLGNESELPKADADCVSHDAYATMEGTGEDATTTYAAGLLAGADLASPTIVFSPGSPKANAKMLTGNFQVQVADAGSGIRATSSVTATASRRDAKETKKIDLSGDKLQVELPLATSTGIPAGVGYHTFTAHTVDKAGNASEKITSTALNDTEPPVTNTIIRPYDKGAFRLIATVTDNLSIKEYWPETRFTDALGGLTITENTFLPQEGAVTVDAYNADDLTTETLASGLTVKTYQAIQTDETTLNALEEIGVWASDHGDGMSADAVENAPAHGLTAVAGTAADNGFDIRTADAANTTTVDSLTVDQPFPAAAYKVFQTFAVDSTRVTGSTVTLKATLTGTRFVKPTVTTADTSGPDAANNQDLSDAVEGLRDNPFTRVDFYAKVARAGGAGNDALKYIGSVNGAAAGSQDFDSTPDTTDDDVLLDSRRYIYELEMSRADFLAIVGGKGDYGASAAFDGTATDAGEGAFIAFAVKDDKGLALQTTAAAELYVKAP